MKTGTVAGLCLAALCCGCASVAGAGADGRSGPVLSPSRGTSHWPADGETRPGIWIRMEAATAVHGARELVDEVRITVDHGGRTQVITGADFVRAEGGGGALQTPYFYTPTTGVLFVTLQVRRAGRWLFPDTQRIELNGDCWHMLSYRVRGPLPSGPPPPPPYPRTVFLTAAPSPDPPLFLDVFLSGNCFRNPLPPS